MEAWIAGVGLWAPGLQGWAASLPILRGQADWVPTDVQPPPPAMLPANERRRASAVIRLALAVAQQATDMSGLAAATLHSVFASSNGDGAVMSSVLEALSEPGRDISPTQFHNSVHNAAVGYWTIGQRSRQPATCLGAYDATWAAALLSAAAETRVEEVPVLLCVYDLPIPLPIGAVRPILCPFAVGLVLTPRDAGESLARITVRHHAAAAPAGSVAPRQPALRALARGNPAAQSLRLLESLAAGAADVVALDYLDGHLGVRLSPC